MIIKEYKQFILEKNIQKYFIGVLMTLGLNKSIAQEVPYNETSKNIVKTIMMQNSKKEEITQFKNKISKYTNNTDKFIEKSFEIRKDNTIVLKPEFKNEVKFIVDPVGMNLGVKFPIKN